MCHFHHKIDSFKRMTVPMQSTFRAIVFLLFSFAAVASYSTHDEVTIMALPDSYTAIVDNVVDIFPANASACTPGAASGQCTLRSALILCADHLVANSRECVVQLPSVTDFAINTSQGEIAFTASDAAGSLIISGEGCRIYPVEEQGGGNGRFLNIEAADGNSLSFQLSNITISNFGAVTTTGGAIVLQKLTSGFLRNVIFTNNTGDSAGAVFIDSCPTFQFVGCLFDNNLAVNDGGGIVVDSSSSGILFESCRFVENRAEQGLGGGLFIRNNNNDVSIHQCNFTRNFAIRG